MKLSGVEISQIYESIFSKDFFNLCFMFNTNRDKTSIKEYINICQDYPLEALQNFSQLKNDEKVKLKNNAKKPFNNTCFIKKFYKIKFRVLFLTIRRRYLKLLKPRNPR